MPTARIATQTTPAMTARPCQRGTRVTTQSSPNATATSAKNAMNTEIRLYDRMYRMPIAEMRSEMPLTAATITATTVSIPSRFPTSARVPSGGGLREESSARRRSRRLSVNTTSPTKPMAPISPSCWPRSDVATGL